ncbi:MAG: hypothetical protein ABSG53_11840 [Thermoguttaceae bacterium]
MRHPRSRVAGKLSLVLLAFLCLAVRGPAQEPAVHYWHQGVMPPGAIGSRQLQRGGPLAGFFQPVEIKAPAGVSISLAVTNQFGPAITAPCRVGLLIGSVYRLRVTNIPLPLAEGMEIFPTIEIIDRTYAPTDQQVRFAIPVEVAPQDIELALQGKFVTRVIYLEDPHHALPTRSSNGQTWFEVAPGHDPLAAADELGRPVAILRMGARVPDQGPDPNFYFGSPAWVAYPPRTALEAKPVRETAPARPAVPAEKKPQP